MEAFTFCHFLLKTLVAQCVSTEQFVRLGLFHVKKQHRVDLSEW